LLHRSLKKHDVAIMLLHWFNAATWFIELSTGAALIVSHYYRIAPKFWIFIMDDIFGGRAAMLKLHITVGVTWISVFLIYIVFGFRSYVKDTIRREVWMDADDWRWVKIRALRILGLTDEKLPPQRAYNAGQKLYAWVIYLATPVVMLTGLVLAFHLGGTTLVAWAVPIHFAAVGTVVAGLIIHVYMGAVFPEEKPAFFSMITGRVNELYAYRHHYKWWRESKLKQKRWLQRIARKNGHSSRVKSKAASATTAPAKGKKPRSRLHYHDQVDTEAGVISGPGTGYWNGYFGGTILGLLILVTFFLFGRGLGASGAFTRFLAWTEHLVAPGHIAANTYLSKYFAGGTSPLNAFLVYLGIGIFIGGFLSGLLARRIRLALERGPRISPRKRLLFAFAGGTLMGIGARLARGCTSGQALIGGATLALGSWAFMIAVFAAAFLFAYFVRRQWI